MEFDHSLSLEENTNVLSRRLVAAMRLFNTPAVLASGISDTKRTLCTATPGLSTDAIVAMLASAAASCIESTDDAQTILDDCLKAFQGLIDRGTPKETMDEGAYVADRQVPSPSAATGQADGGGYLSGTPDADEAEDDPLLLHERVKAAVDDIGPVAIAMALASDGTIVTEYPPDISDMDLAWMAGSVLDYLMERGADSASVKSAFTKCFRKCVKKNEESRRKNR